MNHVKIDTVPSVRTLKSVCDEYGNKNTNKTGPHAFVGKCGNSEDDKLFLIAFDRIVQLDNMTCWDGERCEVFIREFVSLNIRAVPFTRVDKVSKELFD